MLDYAGRQKPKVYSSQEVFAAVSKLPVGKKGSARWSGILQKNVDGIFDILVQILTAGRDPTEAERKKLSKLLREASSFSQGHLRPLFVSSGFIRLYSERPEDKAWVARLCLDEERDCYEHVVPLDFTLDGGSFASDPAAALRRPDHLSGEDGVPPFLTPLARCLLTPVCYLSRHEDLRIHRLDHPDWKRPFARYLEPEVTRDAPDHPIEIYDVASGALLTDAADYTWKRYIAVLREADGYRDGLEWVEQLDNYLASRHGRALHLIESWSPRCFQRRRRSEGGYTADERSQLRAILTTLLNHSAAPQTACGKSAIEVPVNRDRLTIVVRAPSQDCADPKDRLGFRFLIGGDYATRKLYWNKSEMCSDGRAWIEQVAEEIQIRDADGRRLPFKINSNVPPNGFALTLPLPRDRERTTAEKVSAILPELVRAISTLYPLWTAVQRRRPA